MSFRFAVRLVFATLIVVGAVLLSRFTERLTRAASSPFPLTAVLRYDEALARVPAFSSQALPGDLRPAFPARIERGQTVSGLFRELGLEAKEAQAASIATLEHLAPRDLRAGARYTVSYGAEQPAEVVFDVAGKGRLLVSQVGRRTWQSIWQPFRRTSRLRRARGVLEGSLRGSLLRAGADPALALRLEQVLQWDLDFHRDLREGDRFEILFKEMLLDGRQNGVGEVLAVRYENRGRQLDAYRYGENGYYDSEGRPLRKLFLRSPLRTSRVTSGFSHRRFHPVYKRFAPHYGVDYGAPSGTPAFATASGIVESAGWTNGGGNTVRIRHPNGYLTAYLHLSRFASGISKGRRVEQGRTIGYVGSTGAATAPHLDYRVQKHGQWINPSTLASEPAPPLAESELAAFLKRREMFLGQLQSSDSLPVLEAPGFLVDATVAGAF